MNPIERLEALAAKYHERSEYTGPPDSHTERVEAHKTVAELRAIIAALAAREFDYEAAKVVCGNAMKELAQREEAIRKVAEEIEMDVGRCPGFEPDSLKLQPAMVNVHVMQQWAARLRAALEGKHE
jgi:type II secretory pathway component PulM